MEINVREFNVVGKRIPDIDGVELATGCAKYIDDIELPGMLHGKILESPHPHAKIIGIDTSKAEKLPGVVAVITGKDIPYNEHIMGLYLGDQSLLAIEKVRFVGDSIAAVAATNEEIAEKALELIDVKYEVLPTVLDPEEAMKPTTVRIHDESERNIAAVRGARIGDVEAALKAADYVFEAKFHSNPIDQTPMETEGAIAIFEARDRVTVWTNTQIPGTEHENLSRWLGIPKNNVRVVAPRLAGAFGGRALIHVHHIAVALARKVGIGKPVRIIYTREEEFICDNVQRDMHHHFTMGANKDGKIVALKNESLYDTGAYADWAINQAEYSRLTFFATYNVPNISWDAKVVYTNKSYPGAMRGFGDLEWLPGLEQLMNEAADRLNMDQLEFRLKNIFKDGEYASLLKKHLVGFGLDECLQKAAEAIGWGEKPLRWKVGEKKVRAIGLGVGNHIQGWRAGWSSALWRTGCKTPAELYKLNPSHPALVRTADGKIDWRPGFEQIWDREVGRDAYDADPTSCLIKMDEDGSVSLYLAEVAFGTGYETANAIIAAEELGVKPERIRVFSGDTSLPISGLGNYTSRMLTSCGKAVQRAAVDVRNQLFKHAVRVFKELGLIVTPNNLEAKEDKIYIKGTDKFIWVADAAYRAYGTRDGGYLIAKGYYDEPSRIQDTDSGENFFGVAMFSNAGAAEVEIDLETGKFNIVKIALAYDVGRVINRLCAEGQVDGAVAQGIGYACTENLRLDKKGRPLNPNFLKDHVLSSQMIPEVKEIFVERNDPEGPYGAKGLAEAANIPVVASIVSAFRNALQTRIKELPITPETILSIIKEREIEKEIIAR